MAWFYTCIILHPLPDWNCRVSKIDAKKVWAFFFSARRLCSSCSSLGVQCNTVQSLCIFMCNIWRFGNSQDCVDACPRLNWFKPWRATFVDQPINQSIGPNFHRDQHATVAGWREHDGNFDTVQTTLIPVYWKLTTNMEFWFTVYLLISCNLRWNLKTSDLNLFEVYIIIITTITTIITITLRIIPNKILGTGDLFCGPSHHHCHPAGVPCLGGLGFEVRILERGEGDVRSFRSFGLGIWQGWFRMTQTQFLQTCLPNEMAPNSRANTECLPQYSHPQLSFSKWDFRVCSHPLGFTRDSSQ